MPTLTKSRKHSVRTRFSSNGQVHAKQARKRLLTPEDLLKYQLVSDPQISADGTHIVFVRKHVNEEKNEYVTNIWIAATDGKSVPRQFTSGNKDHHPRWSPAASGDPFGDRIAFISGRDKARQQICVINTTGGEAVALTKLPECAIGGFKWSPDGTMLAVSFRAQHPDLTEEAKEQRKKKGLSDPPRVIDDWWYRLDGDGYFIGQRYHLYLVDAKTGAHREVYNRDAMGGFSFDFSPDSKQIVIATNRDRKALIKPWKEELLRLNIATGKLTPIPNLPEGPKQNVKWSPDGKYIAYAGRVGRDELYSTENVELFVCDPIKGEAKSVTGREDYCLLGIAIADSSEVAFSPVFRWTPDGSRLFMQIGWHGESHIASVSPRSGKIHFHTSGAAMHNIGNISDDGKKVALTIGTATKLDEVFVSDVSSTFKPRQLTDFNRPLLKQLNLAKPQAAWVKTADGTRCHTWVMKPPTFNPGKRYPAVLEIHGGPHAQYGVGFFHEFQMLAAHGFVVFFSNPRGSKGYGRDHCAAIRGSWGGADWVDIQAVTEFMKEQPFVNPKKMGVMGGSYGGYMTNWVIGHTHDFAGAISDRCVSNLVSMAGNSDYIDAPDRYWEGNFWDRPETRWDQSPIKYIGNAHTPTLLIHSEGDLRCNVEQSEQIFSALKLLNVPTRFVRYPSTTSHGMSRSGPPDLRIHRLRQILEWWKKWLK